MPRSVFGSFWGIEAARPTPHQVSTPNTVPRSAQAPCEQLFVIPPDTTLSARPVTISPCLRLFLRQGGGRTKIPFVPWPARGFGAYVSPVPATAQMSTASSGGDISFTGSDAKIVGGSRHGSAGGLLTRRGWPATPAPGCTACRCGGSPGGRGRRPRRSAPPGVDPIVPDSPIPLAPRGFSGVGVSVLAASKDGNSAARRDGVVGQGGGERVAVVVVDDLLPQGLGRCPGRCRRAAGRRPAAG